MLSISDQFSKTNRRDFLRIGSLGLAGISLSHLLAAKSPAGGQTSYATGKSVIFLMQHGGPSQYETFDPKMTAPQGICSATGELQTSIPGVTFGGTMEKLAPIANKLTIVRSYQSGSAAHTIHPVVSTSSLNANLGTLYSRIMGTTHPETGMPTNTAIFPSAVDDEGEGPSDSFGRFANAGLFGKAYEPFIPGAGGDLQKNMQLMLPRERLDDRQFLLNQFNALRVQADPTGLSEGDPFQEQAFQVILGGVADAFDLTKEDPRTLMKYNTAPLLEPAKFNHKNNRKQYTAHNQALGKLLLLARRLCEAGCGFVTINTAFVWDMHADVNNLGVIPGMDTVGRPFDHAVAALIQDLEERGLSDRILVIATGEMGRTPRINNNGGRDHWGGITPLLLYGGGLEPGQVIGQSNRDGAEPATTPLNANHLISTILHTLFDVGQLRLQQNVPREIRVLAEHDPIPGLFS